MVGRRMAMFALRGLFFILHISILSLVALDHSEELFLINLEFLLSVPPHSHLLQLLDLFLVFRRANRFSTAQETSCSFDYIFGLFGNCR